MNSAYINSVCQTDACTKSSKSLQMILGAFGLVGLLLKIIGPITITVLISLIGLCLAGVAANSASQNWGISILYGWVLI